MRGMIKRLTYIALFTGTAALFSSCKDMPPKNHGPIVLGDPSTIVTEKDPQKLKDLVIDLQPAISATENTDTTENKTPTTAAVDTGKKSKPATTAPTVQALPAVAGLKAEFTDVSVLIPGLNAKQSGRANLQNASGAVYTFVSGEINGNTIKLTGNITKVSQRYQSVVVLKNEMGTLPLESLSVTTDWETIKGSNNQYNITDLDTKSLEYPHSNASAIRNAVNKAAKRRRYSRRKVQEWEESVHRVRAANQKPLYVMLRSVMWKIDGKDANGRAFSKQIRIDIPM